MTNEAIIITVGILNIIFGFIAGRKSRSKFSVDNEASDYTVDIEVNPAKQKLVIKRITPKK